MQALTDEEVRALDDPGFFQRDDVLGITVANAVREAARAFASGQPLQTAGTSRAATPNATLRNDVITWIDRGNAPPALSPLLDVFDALKDEANRAAYLGLDRYDLQLALYPGDGARYVKHRDAFKGATGPNRRLTAIYYLNANWKPEHGGALRLHLDDGTTRDVEPRLDRLIVFLSDRLEHEVLPAHAERLALTAWYYGRAS